MMGSGIYQGSSKSKGIVVEYDVEETIVSRFRGAWLDIYVAASFQPVLSISLQKENHLPKH
jgi:hypothetical protein